MVQDMANYIKKLTDENEKLKEENKHLKEQNEVLFNNLCRADDNMHYWKRLYYDELKRKSKRLKVNIEKLIEEEDNVL